ncbi:uncharacterized protein LOC108682639 [Hyalella azteca]|uniref:Uncharacterized protein LOC108682639 n=1 Tax=Hyalella azteca TaxID=294128 RepID=A0A979FMQ7_HYAAZ|nr:uncharacterized protein LOC108682639 [Hyalella azteca]
MKMLKSMLPSGLPLGNAKTGPRLQGGPERDAVEMQRLRASVIPEEVRLTSTVSLVRKEHVTLGIVVAGGIDKGYRPRIARLRTGSAAHRCDRLAVGDYIVAVNGCATEGLTHQQIVALLKNSGNNVDIDIEYETPSLPGLGPEGVQVRRTVVSLQKEAGGGVGMTVRGGLQSSHPDKSTPLLITHVRTAGPVDREGTIKAGDRLVGVMGRSVGHITLSEALQAIREAPDHLTLTIEYDVSVLSGVRGRGVPLLVEVERPSAADLGLTLHAGPHNTIVVGTVTTASIAERCGALAVGDTITRIDGTPLDQLTPAEANQLLRSSRLPVVTLEIMPAPPATGPVPHPHIMGTVSARSTPPSIPFPPAVTPPNSSPPTPCHSAHLPISETCCKTQTSYPNSSGFYCNTTNNYSNMSNNYPNSGDNYPKSSSSYPVSNNNYPNSSNNFPSLSNNYLNSNNLYSDALTLHSNYAQSPTIPFSSNFANTFNANCVNPTCSLDATSYPHDPNAIKCNFLPYNASNCNFSPSNASICTHFPCNVAGYQFPTNLVTNNESDQPETRSSLKSRSDAHPSDAGAHRQLAVGAPQDLGKGGACECSSLTNNNTNNSTNNNSNCNNNSNGFTLTLTSSDPEGGYGLVLRPPSKGDDITHPVITAILEDSPAGRCGLLRVGDILTSVNGVCTSGVSDVTHMLAVSPQTVTITVRFNEDRSARYEGDMVTVSLPVTQHGIGFNFSDSPVCVGDSDTHGLVITSVVSGSAAHRSGVIRYGDLLISVGDLRVAGDTTAPQVNRKIGEKCGGDAAVVAVVMRPPSDDGDTVQYTVQVSREGGALGVTLTGSEAPTGPLYVASLVPGGLAERTGAIHVGDRLLAIDGHSLSGQPLSRAVQLLMAAADVVTLRIARPKHAHNTPILPADDWTANPPSVDSAVASWCGSSGGLEHPPSTPAVSPSPPTKHTPEGSPRTLSSPRSVGEMDKRSPSQVVRPGPESSTDEHDGSEVPVSAPATPPTSDQVTGGSKLGRNSDGEVRLSRRPAFRSDGEFHDENRDVESDDQQTMTSVDPQTMRSVDHQTGRSVDHQTGILVDQKTVTSNVKKCTSLSSQNSVKVIPTCEKIERGDLRNHTCATGCETPGITDRNIYEELNKLTSGLLPSPSVKRRIDHKNTSMNKAASSPGSATTSSASGVTGLAAGSSSTPDWDEMIAALNEISATCGVVARQSAKHQHQMPHPHKPPHQTTNQQTQQLQHPLQHSNQHPNQQPYQYPKQQPLSDPNKKQLRNTLQEEQQLQGAYLPQQQQQQRDGPAEATQQVLQVCLKKDLVYEDFGFSVSDGLYEKGVYVNRIRKGGPADRSGCVKPYDRILQVNGTLSHDFDCCLTVPMIASAGDELHLLLSRNLNEELTPLLRQTPDICTLNPFMEFPTLPSHQQHQQCQNHYASENVHEFGGSSSARLQADRAEFLNTQLYCNSSPYLRKAEIASRKESQITQVPGSPTCHRGSPKFPIWSKQPSASDPGEKSCHEDKSDPITSITAPQMHQPTPPSITELENQLKSLSNSSRPHLLQWADETLTLPAHFRSGSNPLQQTKSNFKAPLTPQPGRQCRGNDRGCRANGPPVDNNVEPVYALHTNAPATSFVAENSNTTQLCQPAACVSSHVSSSVKSESSTRTRNCLTDACASSLSRSHLTYAVPGSPVISRISASPLMGSSGGLSSAEPHTAGLYVSKATVQFQVPVSTANNSRGKAADSDLACHKLDNSRAVSRTS